MSDGETRISRISKDNYQWREIPNICDWFLDWRCSPDQRLQPICYLPVPPLQLLRRMNPPAPSIVDQAGWRGDSNAPSPK